MPSASPTERQRFAWLGERGWSIVSVALRVVAEAGWITVLYAATVVVVGGRTPPMLGPLEVVALVALGALAVRRARSSPAFGPVLLVGSIIGGAALGWLASPQVRDMVLADPETALRLHPAGWLGGLAVLRGATVRSGARRANELESMIAWALPGSALLWAVAVTMSPVGLRDAFTATALWGTVALISAGLIGLGLARIEQLELPEPGSRRRLRELTVAVGLAVPPLAVPVGLLSGLPVAEIFAPIVGPARFLIILLAGVFGLLVEAVVEFLRPFIRLSGEVIDPSGEPAGPLGPEGIAESQQVTALLGLILLALVLVVLAVAIYFVARWFLGRRAPDDYDDLLESGRLERSIVVPARGPRGPGRRHGTRRLGPAEDAVGAYLHALAELARNPRYARLPSETPGSHTARLRPGEMPAARELAWLAADYQLVRYGGRQLTGREEGRALGRLARLRRLVRRGA